MNIPSSVVATPVKLSLPGLGVISPRAYVGFMYGATGQSTYATTHANTNKSNIMKELETWYANNLAAYESKIDKNAGFCGDRSCY